MDRDPTLESDLVNATVPDGHFPGDEGIFTPGGTGRAGGAIRDMKHFRVVFQPDDREVSIHQGATLLEAAGQAGIVLSTPCGGKGTCGKCLVQLSPSGQHVCPSSSMGRAPRSSRTTRVAFSMNGNRAGMVHPQKIAKSFIVLSLPCLQVTVLQTEKPAGTLGSCGELHCSGYDRHDDVPGQLVYQGIRPL